MNPETIQRRILELLAEEGDLRLGRIHRLLGLHGKKRIMLRSCLDELEACGDIVVLKGGRYRLSSSENIREGRLELARSGEGKVTLDDGTIVSVPRRYTLDALDGDIVMVALERAGKSKRPARKTRRCRKSTQDGGSAIVTRGSITRVVRRHRTRFTGYVMRRRGRLVLVPPGGPSKGKEFVIAPSGVKPVAGKAAFGRLLGYDDEERVFFVSLERLLGEPDDPATIEAMVLAENDIDPDFPEEVLTQAASTPPPKADSVLQAELKDKVRHDLRHLTTFTIDGPDAMDYDDALSVTPDKNGRLRIFVHVADVEHYVTAGSPLDLEARRRATSIYFPGGSVPMLPPRLSADLCSLLPHRDRLAVTCEMLVESDGRVVRSRIYKSLIRSDARLTYDEVDEILDSESNPRGRNVLVESLERLSAFTCARKKLRRERGGLDIVLPETTAVLDQDGRLTDLRLRRPLFSCGMVEECMLAANECVARYSRRNKLPILFRRHPPPDREKADALTAMLKALGHCHRNTRLRNAGDWQRLCSLLSEREEAQSVLPYVIRAQMRAEYTARPSGHFGLGLEHYCHFTSPIRRYPDLYTHRILSAARRVRGATGWRQLLDDNPERLAQHCTSRERTAESVDREILKRLSIPFASSFKGCCLEGMISSVHPFGFFVRTVSPCLEGLVPVGELWDDYYVIDENSCRLTGRRTGRRFQLGDKLRLVLVRADSTSGRIDFIPGRLYGKSASRNGT